MKPGLAAELQVKFLRPDGTVTNGVIAIGIPVLIDAEVGCGAVIRGLSTPPCTVRGDNALQALRAALQFLAWELYAFVEAGGRVVDLDGEPTELSAIFGQLWAPTPKPKLG